MATQGQARIVLSADDQTKGAFASVGRNFTALTAQASGIKGHFTAVASAVFTAFAAIGALHIVNQLDELNDLSKKTGIAAVTLGGIGFAAKQAGGDLQSASLATGKLNRSLAEAAAGGTKAAEPFKLLGISVTDATGKTKSAGQALIELATAFQGMEDGPEKVALAVRIFGKAGADMIPLLNEGGASLQKNIAYYERYSKVTPEAVAAADEFNDTLTKLRLLTGSAGTEIVSRFLPVFQAIVEQFIESKEKGGFVVEIIDAISVAFKGVAMAGSGAVAVFTIAGKTLGALAAAFVAIKKGDAAGVRGIWENLKTDISDVITDMGRFNEKVTATVSKPAPTYGDFARADRAASRKKGRAPRLAAEGAADDARAVLKKQLEQDIKAIEEGAAEKKLAIEFGNTLARSAYEDGFSTLKEFFAKERQARADALAATTDALDAEIAKYEAFARNPAIKPDERIAAETKLTKAKADRAQAEQEFSNKTVLSFNEERRALEALQDKYNDLQSNILNLQGKTLEASRSRIDQQVREAAKVIAQAGGDPAQAAQLRTLLTNTERLSDAKRQYSVITEAARDAEESLFLKAQESGATELETLRNVGAARKESLGQLQTLAAAAQQLADDLKTPEAIAFARQLGLAFKKAVAEADPLLQRTRELGKDMGDSLASGLESAALEGKTLRQVLQGIEKDLVSLVFRSQVTKPLGDYLGNVIGGNGQASGAGGLLAKLIPSLFGGSGSTSASLNDGVFGMMKDFAGGFATGGTLRPGQWGVAGENGPEPIYAGDTPLHVTPNRGAGGNTYINLTFPGTVDRRTMNQAAMEVGAAVSRAQRRNG